MRCRYIFPKTIFCLFVVAVIYGCAGKERVDISEDVLLNDGERHIKKEDYEKAAVSFKKLLEDYPDSKLRIKAQMGLADALYNQEKYDEAAFQYQRFIEVYPADKNVDKARFYKGMCYFNRKKSIDRNQSYAQNALKEFEYITANFRESEYYKESREKSIICKEHIAENFLHIGKFYYRTGAFHSAISRFKHFLKIYQGQKSVDEVYFYLGKSYLKKENDVKFIDIFDELLLKFPESKYAKKAEKILRSRAAISY